MLFPVMKGIEAAEVSGTPVGLTGRINTEPTKHSLVSVSPDSLRWVGPSEDSRGSMPVGNGVVGLNVWVEPGGEIGIYLGRVGAYDDEHQLLKLARFRLHLNPAPEPVVQCLWPRTGAITLAFGGGRQRMVVRVWVDANSSVVHIRWASRCPVAGKIRFDPWRPHVPAGASGNEATDFLDCGDTDLVWYHQNKGQRWQQASTFQGMDGIVDHDPLGRRVFGGWVRGDGWKRNGSDALATEAGCGSLCIGVHLEETAGLEEWTDKTQALVRQADGRRSWADHRRWWEQFWMRSRIELAGFPEAKTLSRNYTLQRYMQACQLRGEMPPPFNGSIFNVETQAGCAAMDGDTSEQHDADWRAWGNLPWMGQNTRHLYWPLLAAGDSEFFSSLLNLIEGALPICRERVRKWYGHGGVVLPEDMWVGGLVTPFVYGENREALAIDELEKNHLRYHFTASLEYSFLLMMASRYLPEDTGFRARVLGVVEEVLTFFEAHYPSDAAGKLVLFPAGACESYGPNRGGEVTNPMSEIAGLRAVLRYFLSFQPVRADRWEALLKKVPELPVRTVGTTDFLAPAQSYGLGRRFEHVELYAVAPFREVSVAKGDLSMAQRSFGFRMQSLDGSSTEGTYETGGWNQSPVHAALLGLPREAARLVTLNLLNRPPFDEKLIFDYRFPVFWGPYYDWIPDQDHGGVSMTALQTMLLHVEGDTLFLFPSWPEHWDVEFLLHAPGGVTVRCRYAEGVTQYLEVSSPNVVDLSTREHRIRSMVKTVYAKGELPLEVATIKDWEKPTDLNAFPVTGDWIEEFGFTLWGADPGPIATCAWGGSRRVGDRVFLHIWDWPEDGLVLPLSQHGTLTSLTSTRLDFVRDGEVVCIKPPVEGAPPVEIIELVD